jgi:DNA-binding LacI/PurR family transcriptional regulator
MKGELTVIKQSLPFGCMKTIAEEVGCSMGTVHNVLNSKPAAERSKFKKQIIEAAIRLSNENLKMKQKVEEAAANLERVSILENA